MLSRLDDYFAVGGSNAGSMPLCDECFDVRRMRPI